MASDLAYDVGVRLRAIGGPLVGQLNRMARSARGLSGHFGKIGTQLGSMGSSLMGSTAQTAASWGKMAATASLLAGAGGMGAFIKSGVAFNNELEQGTMRVATMFELFKFGQKDARVVSGELSTWQRNLAESERLMGSMFDIAKKTPATFGDITEVYKQAAAGLSTQTQELGRHEEFMKRISLLGGLTDNRYDVLGAQAGRMLAGSAGAEMDVWQSLKPAIRTALGDMGMKNAGKMSNDKLTQTFNKLKGDDRLKVMMEAMKGMSEPVAKAWGNTMAGLQSTTESNIQVIKKDLTQPLFQGYKSFLKGINSDGGLFGKDGMGKWQDAARSMGELIGRKAAGLFEKIERAAKFVRDSWEEIVQTTYKAGQIAAGVIKGAFAVGLTRMLAGGAMRAAGAGFKGLDAGRRGVSKGREMFGAAARQHHVRLVRGARGKGGGLTGKLGKGLIGIDNKVTKFVGEMFGTGGGGKGKGFSSLFKWLAKAGSLAMVFAGGIPLIVAAVAVFGSLFAAIAGVSVYFISAWDEISAALVTGLRNGTISLVPLLTAAYGLWERLKILGAVILGGSTHTDKMNGMLRIFTSIIEFGSSILSGFIRAMAFGLGIWATLKLTFLGLMRVVLGFIELANKAGAISDKNVANARKNYANFSAGVDQTIATGAKLLSTADRLDNFKFDEAALKKIDADAKAMSEKIAKSLEKPEDKKLKTSGSNINIKNFYNQMNVRDPDPSRLYAQFSKIVAHKAEHAVSSGRLPVGGA